MLVLLIVLIVTNLVTLGVLAWYLLRPAERPRPAAELAGPLPADRAGTRRVITIEVRNPVEVAGSRSRWAGIAGSVAPGLMHRLVHDRILRSLRHQLAEQGVAADVAVQVLETASADLVTPEDGRPR